MWEKKSKQMKRSVKKVWISNLLYGGRYKSGTAQQDVKKWSTLFIWFDIIDIYSSLQDFRELILAHN